MLMRGSAAPDQGKAKSQGHTVKGKDKDKVENVECRDWERCRHAGDRGSHHACSTCLRVQDGIDLCDVLSLDPLDPQPTAHSLGCRK